MKKTVTLLIDLLVAAFAPLAIPVTGGESIYGLLFQRFGEDTLQNVVYLVTQNLRVEGLAERVEGDVKIGISAAHFVYEHLLPFSASNLTTIASGYDRAHQTPGQ